MWFSFCYSPSYFVPFVERCEKKNFFHHFFSTFPQVAARQLLFRGWKLWSGREANRMFSLEREKQHAQVFWGRWAGHVTFLQIMFGDFSSKKINSLRRDVTCLAHPPLTHKTSNFSLKINRDRNMKLKVIFLITHIRAQSYRKKKCSAKAFLNKKKLSRWRCLLIFIFVTFSSVMIIERWN